MACAQQPNIIVFLVDDLGWADWERSALNPTGSVLYETPNMTRLASQGVVFNNGYASSPVCSPSRAAIMTGQDPARSHITDWIPGGHYSTPTIAEPPNWTNNLPASQVTLADALLADGYRTGHFGKWHLGTAGNAGANPLANGFQINIGGNEQGTAPGGHFAGSDGGWQLPGLTSGFAPTANLADVLTDRATSFIASSVAANQPFFVNLDHYGVHTPIEAPSDLVAKYQTKISTLQAQGVSLEQHTDAKYAALIETVDRSLGRVLDRLDDPNGDGDTSDSVRDNTLILLTSDNGGLWQSYDGSPTSNRPLKQGKGSVYEGGIRVPTILSWTGATNLPDKSGTQGRVDPTLAISTDFYATALDAAGILGGPGLQNSVIDGRSLLPAAAGIPTDRGPLFWHYPHYSPQDYLSDPISAGAFVDAVRDGDWKLIYRYNARRYELYNLANDIGETTDLISQQPAVAARLSNELRAYLIATGAQFPIDPALGTFFSLPRALLTATPGDFNLDGRVDLADYNVWLNSYGANSGVADANGDGVTNAADYTIWRDAFLAASNAVPEPSSLLLAATALLPARGRRSEPSDAA